MTFISSIADPYQKKDTILLPDCADTIK